MLPRLQLGLEQNYADLMYQAARGTQMLNLQEPKKMQAGKFQEHLLPTGLEYEWERPSSQTSSTVTAFLHLKLK